MLDELTPNQWNERQHAGGEEAAGVPFDFDPQLLPTVHVFTSPGRFSLLTDEAFRKKQAQPQSTAPNPPPEAQEPATQPKVKSPPPVFPFYLLILLFFLLLDGGSSYLTAVLAPTATITIQPDSQIITLHSSTATGKLLSPITVTQSQSVPTTGRGHQDAKQAAGSLTFYNGSFSSQTVYAGTVYTGQDGVKVALNQTTLIPPGNPPTYGEATVSAHAVNAGEQGNIAVGDIDTSVSSDVLVKNSQFGNGRDARDFSIVTKGDRDTAAETLKAKVVSSMTAALNGQLMPGESIQPMPCTPTTIADHAIGEEATQVTVSVSETCNAISYNTQVLTAQATRLLSTQAMKKLGSGYLLYGNVQVTVTKATTTNRAVVLTFTTQGTYLYQLNTTLQQRIKALIAGKARTTALHQLGTFPGIQQVNISGIPDDEPIPDVTHIHILILVEG